MHGSQPPRKVAFYIRVSTERQAKVEEGSLKNQEQMLRNELERRNAQTENWGVFVEAYIDEGLSGKNTNRPAFQGAPAPADEAGGPSGDRRVGVDCGVEAPGCIGPRRLELPLAVPKRTGQPRESRHVRAREGPHHQLFPVQADSTMGRGDDQATRGEPLVPSSVDSSHCFGTDLGSATPFVPRVT